MISHTAREDQLRSCFSTANTDLRPIVTSLNGDNSWLWSFPRPPVEQASTGKVYYHIVFEPWLNGSTSELTSWGIHISLSEPAAATSAWDVEAIVRQIEAAAAQTQTKDGDTNGGDHESVIDAILIGFHYLDHLHEPTLRMFDERIPVIASKEAAAKLRHMDHFDTIRLISDFSPDATEWNAPDLHPGNLPPWLTPLRMPGHHELNYSLALIWTHSTPNSDPIHEVIFQSPHGTRLDQGPLQAFLNSSPQTSRLAIFHGLKEGHAAGLKNTYGAESGLAFFRHVGGTRYWITTHDSPLRYAGIIMRMLWVRDTPRTLEWALEREAKKDEGEGKAVRVKPNLIVVENGGMQVLE